MIADWMFIVEYHISYDDQKTLFFGWKLKTRWQKKVSRNEINIFFWVHKLLGSSIVLISVCISTMNTKKHLDYAYNLYMVSMEGTKPNHTDGEKISSHVYNERPNVSN